MAVSDYTHPLWVEEGMTLFAPFPSEGKGTAIRCRVAVATGDYARVVNEKHGFDRWFSLWDLRVPKDDIHG